MSIIEDGGDGVTMELEMQWDGNPSIILDIKTLLGVALPVQVLLSIFTALHVWLLVITWLDAINGSVV